jgi:hypothetical protein
MTNRIIKDFRGWNLLNEGLLTETSDIVTTSPVLPDPSVAATLAAAVATPPADSAVTTPTTTLAPATPATPAKPAAAKVKAAPPVPTPDLKTANAAALTRNDWAAIQTKLNAVASAADNAAAVLRMQRPPEQKEEPAVLPPYANFGTAITKENKTRSFTKLYESLVPDGLVGPLTLAAVADFVTKYNATPAGTVTPLPTTPPTATTIEPLVLDAIAAPAAPATSTTDSTKVAPTGPDANAGSVFGPSANITEADFAVTLTQNRSGYNIAKYSSATTKLLIDTAYKFNRATRDFTTEEPELVQSIEACKSASDFYKLNAVIKNIMTGNSVKPIDIAYKINDQLGNDDLKYVESIKKHLDGLNIESSFDKVKPAMNYEGTPATDFKENSFKITIPAGSEPAIVFPPAVYSAVQAQSKKYKGSGSLEL